MGYDPVRARRRRAPTHRRSIRLPEWDYTEAGAYFVTIVTYQRETLFGAVVDGEMVSSEFGRIVAEEWGRTAVVRPYVRLDEFVVMPNHIHGILVITDERRGTAPPCRGMAAPCPYIGKFGKPIAGSLPTIVRSFKSAVAKRINERRDTPGVPVWQRNYYEHIVRNEQDLNTIRQYIHDNPARWAEDAENPYRQT
jgi:putative transposase